MNTTKAKIRAWLLDYAWNGTPAAREAEVACIMAQDDWKYIDARIERSMGQWSGEGDHAQTLLDAEEFALSSLYECHEGPHLPTCPCHNP